MNKIIFISLLFGLLMIPSVFAQCSLFSSCDTCQPSDSCGWCNPSRSCTEGTFSGPNSGSCIDTCTSYTSCDDCTTGSPYNCGWRTSTSTCQTGDSTGPFKTTWTWYSGDCGTNTVSDWVWLSTGCPDTTLPSASISATPSAKVGEAVSITVTGNDNKGLSALYMNDGTGWLPPQSCPGTSCSYTWTRSYSTAGTYNVQGYAKDAAGLESPIVSTTVNIAPATCGNGALDAGETCDYASTAFTVGWQCLNYREQYCKSDCSGWITESLGPCNQQCRGDIIACNKAYPGTFCGPVGEEATAVCDYNCNCIPVGTLILLSCTGNQLIQSSEYLTLSWTAVGNAYSYWVYYRSYLSPTYTSGWVFAPITTYVVSGLEAGAYLWYVEAYDSDGFLIATSQIGECGITDLTQTITASKTYAAIGENIELTVTGTVSSPRYMKALAVYFQGDWQYCCCESGCGYGSGSMCLFSGAQSCSNTWGITASSSDLAGGKFTYYSGSYDYGPVGDTEYAQGGGTYGASVVVNQKECNIDQDCINLGKTCAAYPNRYAGCDSPLGASGNTINPTYTCTICGPCYTKDDCTSGNCCTADSLAKTGNPGPGESVGRCYGKGVYDVTSNWLCDPPEWD